MNGPETITPHRMRRRVAKLFAAAATALLLAAPALAEGFGDRFGPGRHLPDFDFLESRDFDRDSFQFAEMGDTGYSDEGIAQFANMIEDINKQRTLRWVLHVGDIKGGQTCADTWLLGVYNQFQQFNFPFVYTPGDNEWADCHGVNLGKFVPTERLARLRQIFFPVRGKTIGKHPMRVVSQANNPHYAQYVENVRWVKGGVVFATIHVVGSNNNLNPWTGIDPSDTFQNPRADRLAEFQQRLAAAKAWLDETFELAERINAPGVFIGMQADPLFEVAATDQRRAGYNEIIEALRAHTVKFGREVMLAHGDGHLPRIDKPLQAAIADAPNPLRRVENFTRIENYGPPDTHWLRVTVNPDGRQVFKAELMTVEKNRRTFKP